MKKYLGVILCLALAGCGSGTKITEEALVPEENDPPKTLKTFSSAQQLGDYLKLQTEVGGMATPVEAEAASQNSGETVTNNQTAGVDEGGLVKHVDHYLVILRRGRLYVVDIGAVDRIPVPKGFTVVLPQGLSNRVWYDELLLSGNTIIVTGYRWGEAGYHRGGIELNTFQLQSDGSLNRGKTFLIESADYFSRNYASRQIGEHFIINGLYPQYFLFGEQSVNMPHWFILSGTEWEDQGEFVPATQIALPQYPNRRPVVHMLARCKIGDTLTCQTHGLIGSWERQFYVTEDRAYLWVRNLAQGTVLKPDDYGLVVCYDGAVQVPDSPSQNLQALSPIEARDYSSVYQINWGQNSIQSAQIEGVPLDQFSFLKTATDLKLFLNLSVEQDRTMICPEASRALLTLNEANFSGQLAGGYLCLNDDLSENGWMRNRFIGNTLVYASGNSLRTVALNSGRIGKLEVPFSVTRIEPAGSLGVIFGWTETPQAAVISPTTQPRIIGTPVQLPGTAEYRSHAYFYRETTGGNGWIGLGLYGDEGVQLLQLNTRTGLRLSDRMHPIANPGNEQQPEEPCEASCIDWYGAARPIMLSDQTLALVGNQLIFSEPVYEHYRFESLHLPTGLYSSSRED